MAGTTKETFRAVPPGVGSEDASEDFFPLLHLAAGRYLSVQADAKQNPAV